MNKKVKLVWDIVSWVLIGLLLLLVIAIVGVRIVGIQPLKVLSGSMEPNVPVGSLLYITKADPEKLEVGDPITFHIAAAVEAPNSIAKDPDQVGLCTHRIVDIIRDEDGKLWFQTKGDANDVSDAYIAANRIEGVYLCHLPLMGYVAHYVQNPPGLYVSIMVALLLVLLMITPDIIASFNKKEEDDDASKKDADSKEGAPETDAPKADAPKADAPKTDAPKTDAPKADAPKADAPKTDAPKAKPAEGATPPKKGN